MLKENLQRRDVVGKPTTRIHLVQNSQVPMLSPTTLQCCRFFLQRRNVVGLKTCTELVRRLYKDCTELVGQIPTSYIRAGPRWARKENPFPSDLNRHMTVLQSKKRTLVRSHATTTQAILHKLVNCTGIPQDAVEAAIGEHDRGRRWDGMGG